MLKPQPNERYFFLRRCGGHPVGVLAMRLAQSHEQRVIEVSASMCAPCDAWDRARGVNTALGRLRAKHARAREWDDHVTRVRVYVTSDVDLRALLLVLKEGLEALGMPTRRINLTSVGITFRAVARNMIRAAETPDAVGAAE